MARKPTDFVHVNLRINEDLRRKLESEAARHQTSLNNEIRVQLVESLEAKAVGDLASIAADLHVRYLQLGMTEDVRALSAILAAKTLGRSDDPRDANTVAMLLEAALRGLRQVEKGIVL